VTRHPLGIAAVTLGALLLGASPDVMAQAAAQVPTREGNVWNGKDHQPTEGQVQHNEQAVGVAPTPSQQNHANAVVNDLDHKLGGCTTNCP